MEIIKRASISAYNEENPDDEISYQEVKEQFLEDFDFASESLIEDLNGVKERWYEQNKVHSQYLNVDSNFVSDVDFAGLVYELVKVGIKEDPSWRDHLL